MNFAYGWAFSKPVRKVYYNITITGLSVAVALIIGTIELVSILADKLGITSGPLAAIGGLDLELRRLRHRRAVRRSPGSSRSRSGGSAGSRRSGRRTFRSGPARTDAPR